MAMGSHLKFSVIGIDSEEDLGLEELQLDAICDLVTLPPTKWGKPLTSYDLTSPCRAMSHIVIANMVPFIQQWCNHFSAGIRDPYRPVKEPQAMRLEKDCYFWPPSGHLAVLVPLINDKTRIGLVARNGDSQSKYLATTQMLILGDTGIHVQGGSLRFICMYYRLQS